MLFEKVPASNLSEGGREDVIDERTYNAMHASADLLCTAKGRCYRGSKVKDFISNQNSMPGAIKKLKSIFCSLGLLSNQGYMNLSQDGAVDELVKDGWSPHGRWYGIAAKVYDNMGIRKRDGYVQYTLMVLLFFSVNQMIKLGVYPDPKRRDYAEVHAACLDRKRLSWKTVELAKRGDPGFF